MRNRNENRPGYKKTKVGWIPKEWDSSSIGRNVDILTGYPFKSDKYSFGPEDSKLLRGDNVVHTNIRWDGAKRWPVTELDGLERYLLHENDIVLAMDRTWVNSGLKCAIVRKEDLPCYLVQRVARIRGVLPEVTRYWSFHLLSHRFEQYVKGNQTETAVPHISKKQIADFLVPLPPLPEQKKIAEILSTWDDAVEQMRKLIDAKKNRKKALMQQLLTDKKRLPGFNESWEEYHLGELFDERREVNCEHLLLLAITGSRGVILATEIVRKDSSSADKSRYKRIAPGDIGYNTMRMWQGVSAVSNLEGIVSPAYTICIPNKTVDVSFMGYFFKFSPVVNLFRRFSQGLVNDTLNLKFHHFAQIKVIIPCLDGQQAISKVLRIADDEIKKLENKLAALEKQKRGLMQKLLTGEVRAKS